jgi:hypothetical protein
MHPGFWRLPIDFWLACVWCCGTFLQRFMPDLFWEMKFSGLSLTKKCLLQPVEHGLRPGEVLKKEFSVVFIHI